MRFRTFAEVEQCIRRIEDVVVGTNANGEELVMSVLIAKSDVCIQTQQQRFQCSNKCAPHLLNDLKSCTSVSLTLQQAGNFAPPAYGRGQRDSSLAEFVNANQVVFHVVFESPQ